MIFDQAVALGLYVAQNRVQRNADAYVLTNPPRSHVVSPVR